MDYQYRKDQELPAIPVNWYDNTGTIRDFSGGWTFTAKVCNAGTPDTIALTKTSGITGAATAPNITIDWSTTDFSTLTATSTGTIYVVYLYARRTADSKDDVFPGTLTITLRPTPA